MDVTEQEKRRERNMQEYGRWRKARKKEESIELLCSCAQMAASKV